MTKARKTWDEAVTESNQREGWGSGDYVTDGTREGIVMPDSFVYWASGSVRTQKIDALQEGALRRSDADAFFAQNEATLLQSRAEFAAKAAGRELLPERSPLTIETFLSGEWKAPSLAPERTVSLAEKIGAFLALQPEVTVRGPVRVEEHDDGIVHVYDGDRLWLMTNASTLARMKAELPHLFVVPGKESAS